MRRGASIIEKLLLGKKFYLFAAVIAAALVLADVWFLFIDKPAGAPAAAVENEPDKYEIRSRLLEDAMGAVGPCSAESAAHTWAEGVKTRSAALQYAAMDGNLKKKYAASLEKTFPNWVTGVSSPWVENYAMKQNKIDKDNACFHIRFSTKTSAGSAGDYDAVLVVSRGRDFWRISELITEPELEVYTGFLR